MHIVPGPLCDDRRRQRPDALVSLAVIRVAIECKSDLSDGLQFPADHEPCRFGCGRILGHGAAGTAAQVESRSNSPAALELASIRNPSFRARVTTRV